MNQKIEINSLYTKKNNTPGLQSPAPRRRILDELSWEDRQKVLGFSMSKINQLNKKDLLREISLPTPSPFNQIKINQVKRLEAEDFNVNIDEALKKLARGGDDYSSMRDYSKSLIKRFDSDNDGIISFQELCDGLKQFDINLALKDRISLMKKLDINSDGQISDIELYNAISTVES